jgi:hypothetical protein
MQYMARTYGEFFSLVSIHYGTDVWGFFFLQDGLGIEDLHEMLWQYARDGRGFFSLVFFVS